VGVFVTVGVLVGVTVLVGVFVGVDVTVGVGVLVGTEQHPLSVILVISPVIVLTSKEHIVAVPVLSNIPPAVSSP